VGGEQPGSLGKKSSSYIVPFQIPQITPQKNVNFKVKIHFALSAIFLLFMNAGYSEWNMSCIQKGDNCAERRSGRDFGFKIRRFPQSPLNAL